jgi:tellurite methyltransferase
MDIAGWENMYRTGQRGGEEHPTALLVETISALRPGTCVDLACGTGRNALYLAEKGWSVLAIDGAASAIESLRRRASERKLNIEARTADLTAPEFRLPENGFDLVLIAYYLQRDLIPVAKKAVRPGGVLIAIAHIPEAGETPRVNRAQPGELRRYFSDWEILHDYEGASRDPAHRRPVAEIVAGRPA